MSSDAEAILGRLTKLGCRVIAQGDRLRVEAHGAVPVDLLQAAREHKADLLELLSWRHPQPVSRTPCADLRDVIGRLAQLAVTATDGLQIDQAEWSRLRAERRRLWDNCGPCFSEHLEAEVLRRFEWNTARCGRCGWVGHDGPCRAEIV